METIAAKKIAQPKPGSKLEALRVMRAADHERPAKTTKQANVAKLKAAAGITSKSEDVSDISFSEMRGDDLRTGAASAASASPQEKTMKTNLKTKTTAKTTKASSARRKRTAKTAKSTAPKAPKAPRGNVVEILKLSCRPSGVSREELNDLTKWKGAPWKWLFKNPKKTGYCDRWGYSLKITEGKDGEVRYHTTKS